MQGSAFGQEDDGQENPQRCSDAGEQRNEALIRVGKLTTADCLLDLAVAPERVEGADHAQDREADPDRR